MASNRPQNEPITAEPAQSKPASTCSSQPLFAPSEKYNTNPAVLAYLLQKSQSQLLNTHIHDSTDFSDDRFRKSSARK